MKTSVIIITKNQKSFLQKSLPILLNQNFKAPYEILVVDSGSIDGSIKYLQSLPVKLIKVRLEAFNYAKVFNIAAQKAKGEYLVRLSGDAIPIGKNWLTEMIKPFKDPKVGATYGIYTITGAKGYGYPDYWPAERFPKKLTKYSIEPTPFMTQKNNEKVYNLAGACCAIRRKIWQKRPFNEKLQAGEDAEYAWFLHLVGWDIVCNPKAKVIHEHRLSESKKKSLFARLWTLKWQRVFIFQIAKFWLKRFVFIDPYRKIQL